MDTCVFCAICDTGTTGAGATNGTDTGAGAGAKQLAVAVAVGIFSSLPKNPMVSAFRDVEAAELRVVIGLNGEMWLSKLDPGGARLGTALPNKFGTLVAEEEGLTPLVCSFNALYSSPTGIGCS